MKINFPRNFLSLTAALVAMGSTHASVIVVNGSLADRNIEENGNVVNAVTMNVGRFPSNFQAGRAVVTGLVFELPTLASGDVISTVQLQIGISAVGGTPNFNVDLYGLGFDTPTAVPVGTDYFSGAFGTDSNPSATGLIDNAWLSTQTAGTVTLSGATTTSLAAYLQGFYTANPGYAGGSGVVFRLNPDIAAGLATDPTPNIPFNTYFSIPQGSNSVLTITTVPEPATAAMLAFGGLILILARHRRKSDRAPSAC